MQKRYAASPPQNRFRDPASAGFPADEVPPVDPGRTIPTHRADGQGAACWRQNALKVMMVWVSWMPGMVCTFSLTKWPMSVALST
ncbi:MAG: hypothetical protein JWQ94_2420 [Tardiphaga sp.]|nr:hypothetical protein [Tardiphaga sp.]